MLVVGRAGEVSALFGGGGLGGFGGFADFKGGDALVALLVWLSGAVGLTFRAVFADCFNSTGFAGTEDRSKGNASSQQHRQPEIGISLVF